MPELVLFIIFCIGIILFFKKIIKNEIFHPVFVSLVYWIAFLLCSIFISVSFNISFSWSGIFPIFLLLFSFIAGSLLISFKINKKFEENKNADKNDFIIEQDTLKKIIITYSLLGVVALILQLSFLNLSIKGISDVFNVAGKISVLRYTDQTDMPKYGLFLAGFMYAGAFLGGVYFINSGKKNKMLISVLPLTVAFIYTIINGAKAAFLFSVFIWISGYISCYVYTYKGIIVNLKKNIFRFLIILFIVLLTIPLVYFLRGGNINSKIAIINHSTISYFASFNAFSIWWEQYYFDTFSLFKYSLSGIHNILYQDRVSGLYPDSYGVGVINGEIVNTNVFTIIRGFIEDFSILGAITIMFLTGILMTYFYYLAKRKKIIGVFLLGVCYSVLFWSFTVNMLNYNTIILSWIITLITIIFYSRKTYSLTN